MNLSDVLKGVADIFHIASGNDKAKKFTSAIVLAGGSSLRMESDTTKQLMLLQGIPVVVHSLMAFDGCDRINEIIVVAKENEIPLYKGFAEKYGIKKISNVVKGGDDRRISALNGFNAVSPQCDYVAIHDAARCLITSDDIKRVLDAAIKHKAAIAATKSIDTVKIADKSGFIERTEDRNFVWLAATPQIFSRNLYCAAAYTADEIEFSATDDSMLVERIDHKVKLVETSRDNIKITTKDDIKKAIQILEKRGDDKNVPNRSGI